MFELMDDKRWSVREEEKEKSNEVKARKKATTSHSLFNLRHFVLAEINKRCNVRCIFKNLS